MAVFNPARNRKQCTSPAIFLTRILFKRVNPVLQHAGGNQVWCFINCHIFNQSIIKFSGTVPRELDLVLLAGEYYISLSIRYQMKLQPRLMAMSPLYPCSKPCSKGTHNKTVKNPALSPAFDHGSIDRIRIERQP